MSVWTEWAECECCQGDDRHCFSCDGTGGDSRDFQECGWCGGAAEVHGKPDPDPKCDRCRWEAEHA